MFELLGLLEIARRGRLVERAVRLPGWLCRYDDGTQAMGFIGSVRDFCYCPTFFRWATEAGMACAQPYEPSNCQHLPEMCGGTIPGWKYDGYCECGHYLMWEGTTSYPRKDWITRHDTPNRCTGDT